MSCALLPAPCNVYGQDATPVVGCYFAVPALTYSFAGGPERGDTTWAIVEARADRTTDRPLRRARWQHPRSVWRIVGDTLDLTITDGLVGWRLHLLPTPQGWQGKGRYLTDVVVVGDYQPPPDPLFTLTRRPCPGPG